MGSAVENIGEDLYWLPSRAALAPKENSKALQVGVVGAGIGGLMAAIALLESGHDVEIYEKSQFKSEVGAAITAPPNSSRVLAFYDLDLERTQATAAENVIYYPDPSDLEKKRVVPVADYVSKYQSPWHSFHRVDLHNELRKMAVEPTAARPRPARLHLDTAVSRLDQDGTIHFENGTSVKKHLVVAADGIRSSFLSTVLGKDVPARHYMSMLRFMVPVEKLGNDPETISLFEGGYSSLRIAYGTDKSVVFYGCRRGALQNVGVIYPPELSTDASGNDISTKEDFVNEVVKEYPKAIQSICIEGKNVGQWKLFTRKPIERLAQGRVVVIGDAAHPMPPVRAQGAAMAIEDAAALGVLFSDLTSEDEVSARLELFNKLRVNRVAGTQIISSMHKWDPTQVSEDDSAYFEGKIPQDSGDLERYSCANNVIRDAFKLLSAHKQEKRS